jgi:hypothetical protein
MSENQNARNEQPAPESKEPVEADLSANRRNVLKKLGRLGLYTAPALLATLESAKACHGSECE